MLLFLQHCFGSCSQIHLIFFWFYNCFSVIHTPLPLSLWWVLLQCFWLTATSIPFTAARYLLAYFVLFFHCSFSRSQPFSVQTWDLFFFPEISRFLMIIQNRKLLIALVVPLCNFSWNLVSVMNPSLVWSVLFGLHWEDLCHIWDVTASHSRGLRLEPILLIFLKKSAQKTKVLENLFNLPWHLWIYPRQLMGSVPSIRVEGSGLNATVDLLPKAEEEICKRKPIFFGFVYLMQYFHKILKTVSLWIPH